MNRVDVVQVIDWAQRQAGHTLTYAVALVQDDETPAQQRSAHGRGLVWLVGRDGNDHPTDPAQAQPWQRMLTRRDDPVGIPPSDRMPPQVSSPYTDGTEHR